MYRAFILEDQRLVMDAPFSFINFSGSECFFRGERLDKMKQIGSAFEQRFTMGRCHHL